MTSKTIETWSARVTVVPGSMFCWSPGRTRTGEDPGRATVVPFVEPRSCTIHWSRQRTTFAWLLDV